MPINPGKKENEEEFIGRCMSEETQTYEVGQAYAICKSKWDKEHMSKFSSPYDRTNSKFNSIRIKRNLINKFETQPTIDSSYSGTPTSGSLQMAEGDCPEATQNIEVNLKNRQYAIDNLMYGPLDINNPGDYWKNIADKWGVDESVARGETCGDCAAFEITTKMLNCIAQGLGTEPSSDPYDVIEAGDLGYCHIAKFKCNANRSCFAHVDGGPITD